MDIFLIILGSVLIVAGILGCFLPVVPGPPLSFLGLLLIHFTERIDLPQSLLWIFAIVTVVVTLLDYVVPLWGTKKFGGTKKGITGATIGVIVGMFVGPWGIIIGPFAGAVIGEMFGGRRGNEAFRTGLGSFVGFLLGTGLKLMASLVMTFYFIKFMIAE
ncbi:MAG: DUF456 domain-containing protein [Bacteroidales bacterium]